jgi:hypothetical protein
MFERRAAWAAIGACPWIVLLLALECYPRFSRWRAPTDVLHTPVEGTTMKPSADFDFEALKWITGPLYAQKRDEWLARTPDVHTWLQRRAEDKDWRTSVTATTLLGWLDHRGAYEGLLRELDDPEPWAKAAKKVNGLYGVWDGYGARVRDDQEYRAMVFPLCLEAVLKHHGEWPYPKTRTFFEMLKQMADPRSIEPLFWYLQNVAQDRTERGLAAFAMQLFPWEVLRGRIAKLHVDQRAAMEALESELDDRALPSRDEGGGAR